MPASSSGSRGSSRRSCAVSSRSSGWRATRACWTWAAAWASRHAWWPNCSAARRRSWASICRCRTCTRRAAPAASGWCRPTRPNCAFATRPSTSSGAATPSTTWRIPWRRCMRHARGAAAGGPRRAGAERLPAGDVLRVGRAARRRGAPRLPRVLPRALWPQDRRTPRGVRGLVGLLQRAGLRVGRVHTITIERMQPLTERGPRLLRGSHLPRHLGRSPAAIPDRRRSGGHCVTTPIPPRPTTASIARTFITSRR